tara:strand:- start:1365 stop:1628 length:264 start_codon:yes stop_codon:yes gene_type:complete
MLNKAYLNDELTEELGYDLFKVNNDVNGNPRYVIHFLAFANTYDEAHAIAKSIGFQKYRGKDFGGGFVSQSYSVRGTAQDIIRVRNK